MWRICVCNTANTFNSSVVVYWNWISLSLPQFISLYILRDHALILTLRNLGPNCVNLLKTWRGYTLSSSSLADWQLLQFSPFLYYFTSECIAIHIITMHLVYLLSLFCCTNLLHTCREIVTFGCAYTHTHTYCSIYLYSLERDRQTYTFKHSKYYALLHNT